MMLKNLSNRVDYLQQFFSTESGRRKEIKRQIKNNSKQRKSLKKDLKIIEKCILLLDKLAQNTEGKIVELFQSTVSAALKDIFDESYDFRFEFGKRGNVSTCEYQIRSAEFERWNDIIMSRGKSVAQIIALVLRIILVKIDKDSPDIVLFDEPLDGLSPDRKEVAGRFIKELCRQLGIQIIMITHSVELADYVDKKVML